MVDRILSQEDQEIEELVSLMQHAENADNLNQSQRLMSDYGSDEEEYDQLFIEVMSKVEGHIEGAADAASGQDHQMDMSSG